MTNLKCKCGHELQHHDNDSDDTGHYEILKCSECDTKYHVYEDGEVWEEQETGLYSLCNNVYVS